MPDRLFVVVDAPTDRPPRGATLLRSAGTPVNADDRWVAGITYTPEACGDGEIVQAAGYCGDGGFAGFPDPDDWPLNDDLQYVPPYVAVAQACSAIGGEQELTRVTARAQRLLELCATKGIGRELWRGDVAQAESLPNNFLANASSYEVVGGGIRSVLDGFSDLEQALADCSCAGAGMIHVTPRTAVLLSHLRVVERQPDGRLLSALGTYVVADPGYDGSDDAGAVDGDGSSAWAYATGMVDVRLGPTDSLADRTSIRTRNDFTAYAFRPFAATFDPCCHLAVQLDHSTLT